MLTLGGIDENLRFLILEVSRQVERTRSFLGNPTDRGRQAILKRDDYIDRLRTIIQRKCFVLAGDLERDERMELPLLRAIDSISSNLEKLADYCEGVAGQLDYLTDRALLEEAHPGECLELVAKGLDLVEDALLGRDVQTALEICRVEHQLDKLFADTFKKVLAGLESGGSAPSLVTVLFISHYFERMGDAMLNIGEGILSACLGEKIKIDEFLALQESVEESEGAGRLLGPNLSLEALGETRSGCRIDRLTDGSGDAEHMVIVKEGRIDKLAAERDAVELWNRDLPGHAPNIYSFQERDGVGAILYEYLPGRNFEELVLRSDTEALDGALETLFETLGEIWSRTRIDEPAPACFVPQLEERLPDVFALHPELRHSGTQAIGRFELQSFEGLAERARALEVGLSAPFSVRLHGDMNVDNVIFDPIGRRVRFVDLRRSTMGDYVQDVSVFLVSHFRLQVFEAPIRRRIQTVIQRTQAFVGAFAASHEDTTYEMRLGLGLARSFATSARFVIDEDFAKSLFWRARYLLERLVERTPEDAASYRVPEDIFVD